MTPYPEIRPFTERCTGESEAPSSASATTLSSVAPRLAGFSCPRRAHASACACPRRLKPPLYAESKSGLV
jgi:hypothetical protein